MVLLAGLKNNEAFLDMILRPQACAGISLQQQRSEEESCSAFHNKLCDIFFLLVGKSIVITIPWLIQLQSLETWATNICAMEDQRMESSAAVGSLKRNSRQKSHAWIMTSALCVATTSATIPRDHKVRDALRILVTSTSLLWLKIISCSSHPSSHPSSAQGIEQFFLPILFNHVCFEFVPIYVSSHFSIALDNLKSLYISHLISPTRPRLSVL